MNLPAPTALMATALAVLAFVVAFYVLLARERKIPYITNFIFPRAVILFAAILFAFLAQLTQPSPISNSTRPPLPTVTGTPETPSTPLSGNPLPTGEKGAVEYRIVSTTSAVFIWSALICLLTGIVFTSLNIWRLHNRQVNFRDDVWMKSTRIVRWLKRRRRLGLSRPTYEHSPVDVNAREVKSALKSAGILVTEDSPLEDVRTIAICRESLRVTDSQITELCLQLVNLGWYIQYTTCIRHPYEFIQALKKKFGDKWTELARRIVVVDAYTPHFGFTDSIHDVKTNEMTREGVQNVVARDSYAGVHTANARAFNKLKSLQHGEVRKPALLLYEGANALVDLESTEQYRVFARHVLTSERMWGGMLTLFIEPTIGQAEMDLLRSYADEFFCRDEVQ